MSVRIDDKAGNVGIKVTLRRVRVNIVTMI
jgi:hypothetical protein